MKFVVSALLLFTALGSSSLPGQTSARFSAYEHCRFADDLALVENTALPTGVEGRTVKTIMGPKQVPLAGGRTLVFGYPQTEPFATVKVEQIPAASYTQAKGDLIANFEQILTADDSSSRNYALKPKLNGLEIYGLDRKQLEGGVLGIYLFFVDRTHTVTTVYFLNQDPAVRSFKSLDAYAGLRDTFLNAYTICAAGTPRSRTAAVREAAGPVVPAALPAEKVVGASALPGTPASTLPDAPSVQTAAVASSAPPGAAAADSAPSVPSEAAPVVAHQGTPAPAHKARPNAARATARSAGVPIHNRKVAAAKKSTKPATKLAAKKRTSRRPT